MKSILYKGISGLVFACAFMTSACNDLLDEAPDNRTEINEVEKVKMLMASAYPVHNPAVLCELSGDNLYDNNVVVPATHRSSSYDFHEEAYAWEDVVNYSAGTPDTPSQIWETYFSGIAVCNHALAAIEDMEKRNPSLKAKLDPYRGEALVTRAYLHFVLVNVFAEAYRNDELSKADPGIPYVTDPETTVQVHYERLSVADVYSRIQQDIKDGIDLIDDSAYGTVAYHMNRRAANAFAARFYLYKRNYEKVISHADKVLGTNPASVLRKWSTINQTSPETSMIWYCNEKESANLLMQVTYSSLLRFFYAGRFVVNAKGKDVALSTGGGPCWGGSLPCYSGNVYYWGKPEYGSFLFRIWEFFEYTDKIAGIGYVHTVFVPFSMEETLLCRAEARLFLDDEPGCIEDLNFWAASKQCTQTLSRASINRFYTASRTGFVCELNNELMDPEWKISESVRPVVDCILHFRRIETLYEGLRWFDIKRYGIPVAHTWKGPNEETAHTDTLTWFDPRRALQIPNDVIEAGLQPNDRFKPDMSGGSSVSAPVYRAE